MVVVVTVVVVVMVVVVTVVVVGVVAFTGLSQQYSVSFSVHIRPKLHIYTKIDTHIDGPRGTCCVGLMWLLVHASTCPGFEGEGGLSVHPAGIGL